MKKLLVVFFLFSFGASLFAQTRVADRSGRKPSWVNGLEADYIIVVGTGSSIQDAQRNALNMVRENIVNAVAQNVQATSEMTIEEANFNNNVSVFLEKHATTITTTSGPVPYLQGVSLSNVDEYYWEKIEDRRTRVATYNYHIKYPFSNFELQKLVMEFRMRDRELTGQLEEILASIDRVHTIEDIEKGIAELRILQDYFVDGRREQARMGMTRLRNLYNTIELVEIDSKPGELKYALRFRNDFATTAQRPQITSDCARVTGTSTEGHVVTVTYDYYNCYEDPENHLMVRYRFGNTNVQNRFYFDITADKASIFVNEPLQFAEVSRSGDHIDKSTITITVVSRYEAPFTIDQVSLEWQGHSPVVVRNIGKSFSGKGNHTFTLEVDQPLNIENLSSSRSAVSMLSGHIHYKSDRTGEMKTFRMFNQRYSTTW